MSEIWIVMAQECEWAEVRAVLGSEETAIALARDLTEREAKSKRYPEWDFVIEKHQLNERGETVKREIIDHLDPRLELTFAPVTFMASIGYPP